MVPGSGRRVRIRKPLRPAERQAAWPLLSRQHLREGVDQRQEEAKQPQPEQQDQEQGEKEEEQEACRHLHRLRL